MINDTGYEFVTGVDMNVILSKALGCRYGMKPSAMLESRARCS